MLRYVIGPTAGRVLLALFAIFIAGIPIAAAQNTVPPEFQGVWVPVNAACNSSAPVRVQVAAQVLTLFNSSDSGNDSAALGGIEMAGPGYFPPGYRGIEAVLFTEFSGHQPAIMTFNAGEKKGVAQVAFAAVTPGKGNAQLNAINARIAKLNLAKRFPLNNVPLKKCA
jgi:hypothetical protein